MLYSDQEPAHSFSELTGRDGGTDETVLLLPYQRALLIILVDFCRENPLAFFNDYEDIDTQDFTDKLDDIQARLIETT